MSKETVTIDASFEDFPMEITFTGTDLSNTDLAVKVIVTGIGLDNEYMEQRMMEAGAGFPYAEASGLVGFPPTQILWAFQRMGVTFEWPNEIPTDIPSYIGQEFEVN